jgi:hypothetical protein
VKPPSSTSPSAAARRLAWAGFAAVLLVRLAVFPFAKNFYGDPIMRLEALTAWLKHPYFLKSFIGAKQFGPLHLYLLALGQWIQPDLEDGPRLISLVFGSLTAFPLFRLAERRFGPRAAFLAVLGLAIYPLHLQASTTAASEAVFLWFLLWAVALLDSRAMVLAGLVMAGACAVRYDGWFYAPLTWLWLAAPLREKRVSRAAALTYVAASLAVPIFLCVGNWIDLRSPFFVLRYVQENHVASAVQAAAAIGRWTYAAYCLLFWPANLAWELSPPIAFGGAVGVVAALREKRHRDLLWLAAVPAAIFSVEGVLLRFHPLARFTMPAAVLLLPYAGDGLLRVTRSLQASLRPAFAALAVLTGAGLPAFLAWRTLGKGDSFADTLRPLSPVSNLPPDLEGAADWIRAHAANRKVEVETNWLYEELPIEFYGRGEGAEVYSPRDGAAPPGFEPPDLLVLPKDSDVLKSGEARLNGTMLEEDGRRYLAVARMGQVQVFQRIGPGGNGY